MPREMLRFRLPGGMLSVADRLPVVAQENLLKAAGAIDLVGHQQDAVGDGERSQVERFVMQSAQGQAVAFRVGSTGLVPAYVRCIQSDGYGPQTHIETADGTAVLVSLEHSL